MSNKHLNSSFDLAESLDLVKRMFSGSMTQVFARFLKDKNQTHLLAIAAGNIHNTEKLSETKMNDAGILSAIISAYVLHKLTGLDQDKLIKSLSEESQEFLKEVYAWLETQETEENETVH